VGVTDAKLGVRRATLRLGALAAVLLVAGVLPWVTGGSTGARLVALPLLVAGIGVTAVVLRVRSVLAQRAAVAAAYPAPLVERGCDGCACGAGGCGSVAPEAPDAEDAEPAAG
jgi:hypothetical protein